MSTPVLTPIVLPDINLKTRAYPRPCPATLTPIDPGHGLPPVYLVSVDEDVARHYGCSTMANRTIGGIVKVRGGWCPVAYLDRDAFLFGDGKGYDIPVNAATRAQAVRMLLFFWHVDQHPDWEVAKLTSRNWLRTA